MDLRIDQDQLTDVSYRTSAAALKDGDRSLLQNGVFCWVANGVAVNCPGTKPRIARPRQPETAQNEDEPPPYLPTRLQVLTDLANLCTLAGASLATVAMACMWRRRYFLGMFLNVLANIADIIDGPIARSTANRHPTFSVIGSKLDCYSDLVSHFVVPASLLMNISDLHPICVTLAALYICSGIMRQSYFEVTGRCNNGSCIYGLTSDYMVAIYCITMHLLPIVGFRWMGLVLSVVIVGMMFGCLTFSLRSRRYEGFGLFTVTLFNVWLSISCLILYLFADDSFAMISGNLFTLLLISAYPLYFRFVEINK